MAVIYKVFEDRAPYLAALVTYYAFVSLFPLLLLFTSVAGFVLQGNPHLKQQVMNAALSNFPGIGHQLQNNIRGFRGSGAGLAVGVIGVLYGGLGATQAAQAAFNKIYAVPRRQQPDPLHSRVRSLGLLILLGTGILVTGGISALFATRNSIIAPLGVGITVLGYVVSFLLNVALFSVAVQLLTAWELRWRDVFTGGAVAGFMWELLQAFGSRYVAHEISHGNAFYGVFGVVLATVAWIYLESLALMISAEISSVIHYQLWPRALLALFSDKIDPTPADMRAYSLYASAPRFKSWQVIDVHFGPREQPTPPPAPVPERPAAPRRRRPKEAPAKPR